MSENIKQMKTHNKGNLLINRSAMLYIFNTKEFMLDFIEYVTNLQDQLQQKENIIKEVRELLKRYQNNEYYYKYDGKYLKSEIKEDILEILDKVGDEK